MKLADLIRRHVVANEPHNKTSRDSSTTTTTRHNSNSIGSPVAEPWFPWIVTKATTATPGLLEGATAAVVTLGLFAPVRTVLLRAVGKTLGDLPELVLTSSQIMLAANAGLYTMGLYGSRHYLQQLSRLSTTPTSSATTAAAATTTTTTATTPQSPMLFSPTADAICRDDLVTNLLQQQQQQQQQLETPSTSSLWDPRVSVLNEMQQALETCRQRISAHAKANNEKH
jgi:hypothetical protein